MGMMDDSDTSNMDSTDSTDSSMSPDDTYKKMYEMGQQLMQMAQDCGYDPAADSETTDESDSMDSSESDTSTDDSAMSDTSSSGSYPSKKNKVAAAMSMFGR